MIERILKHDRHVEILCEKLKPHYPVLLRHIPLYSKKRRPIGEVDVLAIHANGDCDIYEVKCSYRITKAKRQLRRIRRIISSSSRIRHTFFYCGDSKVLVKCS